MKKIIFIITFLIINKAKSQSEFWGMTLNGGANYKGVIFNFNLSSPITNKKLDFNGVATGAHPRGGLFLASDKKIYGMTNEGGLYGYNGPSGFGVMFKIDPATGMYTKLIDFDNTTNGKYPCGNLMQATDGMLYGTTIYNIFKYNISNGTYTVLPIPFGSQNGSLVQASNGKLYGTTYDGGINGGGFIFEIDIQNNTYSILYNFDNSTGAYPEGSLIQASNGMLYGLTSLGGSNSKGVLFEFNPNTGAYNVKVNFLTSIGEFPKGALLEASDGMLYGFTNSGGTYNYGVIFQFNPNNGVITKKIDLSSSIGVSPVGSFIQASNGKLYGLASGYSIDNGAVFEYDINTNACSMVALFLNNIDGSFPISNLVEVISGINTESVSSELCSGATCQVSGLLEGSFNSTNIFTAELSDEFGSFSSPTNIGAVVSNSVCLINATIPSTTIPGNAYRIRVVSSNPSVVGSDNGNNIVISNSTPTLNVLGISSVCINSNVNLSASGANTYTWNTGVTTSTISLPIISNTLFTVNGSNACGVSSLNFNVSVDNTCQDVWPGDANSDGIADNLDVLELGLHYTQTGPPRASTSNAWQSYFANNWTGTITNGKNLNHGDCNGDGTINDDDTLAIYNNYGLTHAFKPVQTNTVNPQLSIVPDQAAVVKGNWGTASIYLGDAITSINNINGVAFTVDFDNTLIETNNIYIEYQNSFLDIGQNLKFRKLDFANGKIFTATTHTISNNVSGNGLIAKLHYQIKSSLTTDQTLNLGISQANQSDASGVITPLTTGTGTLMALGASVGLQELNGSLISISPNPTNGSLTINSKTELQKIEVISITGQVLLSETPTNVSHTLYLQNFANGIYFVNVYQNDRIVKREKIVLNK